MSDDFKSNKEQDLQKQQQQQPQDDDVDLDEKGKLTDPENVGKLMTALRMIKKVHPLQNKITIA